jgi:hypothetical protein
MKRSTTRFTGRRKLGLLVAAGVIAASAAAVVTTTTLAQSRPDRYRQNGGNGGNGGGNGYGNGGNDRQGRDRQNYDRQNFDRQNFDRSRRFGNNNGGDRPQGGWQPNSAGPSQTAATQSSSSASASQPATQSSDPPPPPLPPLNLKPSDYTTKYVLLEEKNIFLKSRHVVHRDPNGRVPGTDVLPPRKPEEMLVLRGTALQEGRRVAFVENLGSNTTSRLTPDSSILSGKITDVGRDYIEYEENGGRKMRIEIGHNFAGAVAAGGFYPSYGGGGGSSGGSFTVSGSASASSGAAPPDPNNPSLSVEERMKLKRLQEQQKQPQ